MSIRLEHIAQISSGMARDAYLSIRALNIELARIPDLVSNPTVGALRMQFWRDSVTRTLAGTPPKEPVAILLHTALKSLHERYPGSSTNTIKVWLMKVINAREQYMNDQPYPNMDALETYAENTYSTLSYLTFAALPLHSMAADHLASHLGKASGIVAVLRGLPLRAFPPPPNLHSNNAGFVEALGGSAGGRQGTVILPLDIMAECGVKEEEVFRLGADAPGLKDAVFKVATRANDHLITAREMLKNIKQGNDAGHDFEYDGHEGHQYTDSSPRTNSQFGDVERGFGVLMSALPARLWLEKLEKFDFDVFKPQMLTADWKLPFKAYSVFSRKVI
ncbi:hypothetical protein B7463_g2033, partial [Scytalidium lignicola]